MGNWLTELRTKAGYKSLRSLSADCRVDVSTLARIERDLHVASPETLKRLAPHLKTPYIRLLGICGHLADDKESQKAAEFYRENPKTTKSKIEEDWPEVCQVLRAAGTLPTPAERSRIAKIIRLTLGGE